MRPAQTQTRIFVGDRRAAVISASGQLSVERILEDRPCLLATQLTPKTVQLLLVKLDSLARVHECVRTQSVPDQAIRLDIIAAFDNLQVFHGCISLDVIPDKVSEMMWDAFRSSLSVLTHHLTYVPIVKLVKLIIGCSPIPTLLRVVKHQHIVTHATIQETRCHSCFIVSVYF